MNRQQTQRVVNLLTRARDLIQTNGWCRDDFEKSIGGVTHYCALGALEAANGGNTGTVTYDNARQLLNRAVGGSIMTFNDTATANGDRRYVLRAYNRAIRLATT